MERTFIVRVYKQETPEDQFKFIVYELINGSSTQFYVTHGAGYASVEEAAEAGRKAAKSRKETHREKEFVV